MPKHHILAILGLLLAAPLAAQAPSTAAAERGAYAAHAAASSLRAIPTRGIISLDGLLDEAAWLSAPATTDFTQEDPAEGQPGTDRTEVRVVYDRDAIYIGARMYQTAAISSRLGRRDSDIGDSDRFAVSLDTYHDHLMAFRFEVNPSGVKGDGLRGNSLDLSWNAVWDVATRVDSLGWTAEFRIPFSQLRFGTAEEQTWGLQFARETVRSHEHVVFAFTPKSERGGVARYGHLTGLHGLHSGRRLELLPYATARSERGKVDAANPFRDGTDQFAGAGLDLKYGLTSNLTLSATVNPDFGQVEMDPAQINLSAYEVYYDEKRPFFVEGSDVFDFPDDGVLYSRRIGAPPQLGISGAAFSDVPRASTILGAAKLTGKTPSGWSLGMLEAITSREEAPFVDEDGARGRAVVAPTTNFFAARARRDLRAGRSTIGGILTAVDRDLSTPGLARSLRSSAYVVGVDFRHETTDRSWSLDGSATGSRIAGSAPVLLAAQRSSARYFQRPDSRFQRLDSAATGMSGYAANLSLSREAGRHWRGGVDLSTTSPGYEINDLGFLSSVDRANASAHLVYVENTPGRLFRQWSVTPGIDRHWNYDGDALSNSVSLRGSATFANYWSGNLNLRRSGGALDDRFTRGGPVAWLPVGHQIDGRLQSDGRRPLTVGGGGNYWSDRAGSWRGAGNLDLAVRASSSWNLSLGPSLSRTSYVAQWAGSRMDSTATRTFGVRYLYAGFRQTTLAMAARLNVTFTPELTLETYLQPYISSGDYEGVQELRAPRTFDFVRYGKDAGTVDRGSDGSYLIDPDAAGPAPAFTIADPNFNYRALRGSAVLRWEFRPGSTIFLVWQQQRSDNLYADASTPDDEVGRFAFSRDARALFGLPAENVFLLKVNYWINP
jgi:hypothetical protein